MLAVRAGDSQPHAVSLREAESRRQQLETTPVSSVSRSQACDYLCVAHPQCQRLNGNIRVQLGVLSKVQDLGKGIEIDQDKESETKRMSTCN